MPQMFEGYVTKIAPHKVLKLIVRDKLTSNERIVLNRVACGSLPPLGVAYRGGGYMLSALKRPPTYMRRSSQRFFSLGCKQSWSLQLKAYPLNGKQAYTLLPYRTPSPKKKTSPP